MVTIVPPSVISGAAARHDGHQAVDADVHGQVPALAAHLDVGLAQFLRRGEGDRVDQEIEPAVGLARRRRTPGRCPRPSARRRAGRPSAACGSTSWRTRRSLDGPGRWVNASSAPSAYRASLIAQAMLRSLATPITRPILPVNMPMRTSLASRSARSTSNASDVRRAHDIASRARAQRSYDARVILFAPPAPGRPAGRTRPAAWCRRRGSARSSSAARAARAR